MKANARGNFPGTVATRSFGRWLGSFSEPFSLRHSGWLFDFCDVGDGLRWEMAGPRSDFLPSDVANFSWML
ncbi:hypothetical protein RchiOBHm_Chr3g0455921 [Rosa chinensis]|uniref:Uncharacterized protein n=1 Tax=Rosa chinensis TaxID=74649 RepID=A0A2P6R783_ROSCH|nr:hypothetical protein RchiOBHm_Chr3g0455921 [Rosa chinensis]